MKKMQNKAPFKGRYYFMAFTASFMLFVSCVGMFWIHEAQAIRVSMKRIVFEGPKRSDIITIMNNSAQEQTYRLGWRRYRMYGDRTLVNVSEDEEAAKAVKWADHMIRYAPRRVTVPPGGSQQIRVLLRRPRDLEEGEYRAHLWIITEQEADRFEPDGQAGTGQSSFRLSMMPAITMPIFVRHGQLEASADIIDARITPIDAGNIAVSFVLHRSGNRSLYGDLNIICTGGSDEYVGHYVRGIAVYPEVNQRNFEYDIKVPPERAGDCRQVRIEYVADKDDNQYGGQLMAQTRASL